MCAKKSVMGESLLSRSHTLRGQKPRLLAISKHPAQTYVDLYARLAESNLLDLKVLFLRDTTEGFFDSEFGRNIKWDVDLLAGYESHFLRSRTHWTVPVGGLKASRLLIPSPGMLVETLRWLKTLRPDVVMLPGHGDSWYLVVWAICRFMKIPYIVRGTGIINQPKRSIRSRVGRRLARAFVRKASVFCYIGVVNYFYGLANGAKAFVFSPYAISDERFLSHFRDPELLRQRRQERGLHPGLPVIVFSGKLQPWKRPQDLIVAQSLTTTPVQSVFLGEGPMRGELEQLAGDLGVEVHFAGFVNQTDMPDWYSLGDVFVLPSGPGGDTWGLAVNEAIAVGLTPVVSNAVPSWPDLAWADGGVFPYGDAKRLAECIVAALDRRSEPSHALALDAIKSRYSIDAAARGIEEAVRQATSNGMSME